MRTVCEGELGVTQILLLVLGVGLLGRQGGSAFGNDLIADSLASDFVREDGLQVRQQALVPLVIGSVVQFIQILVNKTLIK